MNKPVLTTDNRNPADLAENEEWLRARIEALKKANTVLAVRNIELIKENKALITENDELKREAAETNTILRDAIRRAGSPNGHLGGVDA